MCLFEFIYDKENLESYSYKHSIAGGPKRKNPAIGSKETVFRKEEFKCQGQARVFLQRLGCKWNGIISGDKLNKLVVEPLSHLRSL